MAERIEKKKAAPARTEEVVEEAPPSTKSGEQIKADLDELLDEIDGVLEENAEGIRQVIRAERGRVTTLCGHR